MSPFLSSYRIVVVLFLGFLVITKPQATAQEAPPTVLIVTAHPDDEAMFAAVVYRITQELGGKVDLALITNGAGGYRYSMLANPIYGMDLTDPEIAREYLPAIRKRELMAGGEIIGIRNYFFMDQPDAGYTLNVDTVFAEQWDLPIVRKRLHTILKEGQYDFILTHLPIPQTHGHHKGATLLALEAAQQFEDASRPIVLGSFIAEKSDTTAMTYKGLDGHSLSRIQTDTPPFLFDREQPFGFNDRLNYKIVVNWLIAEHKTQGTMQLLVNRGDIERFWLFEQNPKDALQRTRRLFKSITP